MLLDGFRIPESYYEAPQKRTGRPKVIGHKVIDGHTVMVFEPRCARGSNAMGVWASRRSNHEGDALYSRHKVGKW